MQKNNISRYLIKWIVAIATVTTIFISLLFIPTKPNNNSSTLNEVIPNQPTTLGIHFITEENCIEKSTINVTVTEQPTQHDAQEDVSVKETVEQIVEQPINNYVIEPLNDAIETEDEEISDSNTNDIKVNTKNDNENYLLDINNPDYDYTPSQINLTPSERDEIAKIIMGEFGSSDFTGCALIAQAIRDAMNNYGCSAMNIRSQMQYYEYNEYPNSTCYDAVDWIFEGNAVVQHRILVMNNSNSGWHSTQNLIIEYKGVWFYDLW
jgi:hypothetical protein